MMSHYYLSVFAFLCWVVVDATGAGACGWWGDGGIDDSDPVLVETGDGRTKEYGGSIDDPAVQTRLGNSFRSAAGAANYRDAVYWYRKAAEQGFAAAQNNLAVMYEQGLGVPKDEVEAAKWYRRAAEQNDAKAQHSVGVMYRDGRGVTRNPAEAFRWILRSAEQGHPGAFRDLGEMYHKGLGVSQNSVRACMWWKLGVLHGNKDSDRLLGMAVAEMDPVDVKEAEKLAQEWMERNY